MKICDQIRAATVSIVAFTAPLAQIVAWPLRPSAKCGGGQTRDSLDLVPEPFSTPNSFTYDHARYLESHSPAFQSITLGSNHLSEIIKPRLFLLSTSSHVNLTTDQHMQPHEPINLHARSSAPLNA